VEELVARDRVETGEEAEDGSEHPVLCQRLRFGAEKPRVRAIRTEHGEAPQPEERLDRDEDLHRDIKAPVIVPLALDFEAQVLIGT
jgi:hypothetical protein